MWKGLESLSTEPVVFLSTAAQSTWIMRVNQVPHKLSIVELFFSSLLAHAQRGSSSKGVMFSFFFMQEHQIGGGGGGKEKRQGGRPPCQALNGPFLLPPRAAAPGMHSRHSHATNVSAPPPILNLCMRRVCVERTPFSSSCMVGGPEESYALSLL